MDIEVDHYVVLDLPSGEEGAKLSEIDISKKKALELQKSDDPINAHIKFQKLKTSYDILKDEKKRKLFDDLLRMKREMIQSQQRQEEKEDFRRRKIDVFVADINLVRLEEEERIAIKLLREIARIHEILVSKKEPSSSDMYIDKEKVLKVSWDDKKGEDYSCQRLKEIFSNFGKVEHVIMSYKKKQKPYALVEMSSKEEATKAASCVLGDLKIVPLQPPSMPSTGMD